MENKNTNNNNAQEKNLNPIPAVPAVESMEEKEKKAIEQRKAIARKACYDEASKALEAWKTVKNDEKALAVTKDKLFNAFSEKLSNLNQITLNHTYDAQESLASFLHCKVWAKWALKTENKVEKLATENVRLNVCNFIVFKRDNFSPVENDKLFIEKLNVLTMEISALIYDEMHKDEENTGSIKKAHKVLEELLQIAGLKIHARKQDARFLKNAVFRVSSKNLSEVNKIKPEKVAEKLPDVINAIENGLSYEFSEK